MAKLDQRLGPHLRELAAGANGAATPDASNVAAEISACASGLADDLRIAVLASLGLSAETRHMAKLKDRIIWLSVRLGHGYRTAQRRIDAAERMLAEEIAHELRRRHSQPAAAPIGWHLDEFRTVLRLDLDSPEAHEHRRIVATRDDLKEVMAWLDVPRDRNQPHPGLLVEVAYGGLLVRRKQPSRNRFQFMIQLPSPLRAGDTHEYGLILRIPEGEQMRTHYIFTPECECNVFALRVRFAVDRPPRWVRRVEGETVRTFDAAQSGGYLLNLDNAGEVEVMFRKPIMYLGYGIQWAW